MSDNNNIYIPKDTNSIYRDKNDNAIYNNIPRQAWKGGKEHCRKNGSHRIGVLQNRSDRIFALRNSNSKNGERRREEVK